MEKIRQTLSTFDGREDRLVECAVDDVRKGEGTIITSYRRLVECVAKLAFANPGFVLLFRGQTVDYCDDEKTTLYPIPFNVITTCESIRGRASCSPCVELLQRSTPVGRQPSA
jgi:hypothetical protein